MEKPPHQSKPLPPAVAVVVLNWNRGPDTGACLASVFASAYGPFRVIVCDNGSDDDSLIAIEGWAAAASRIDEAGRTRPLQWARVERSALAEQAFDARAIARVDLLIVANGANLGFAGGNNVGVRFARDFLGAALVWLLNNDTIVEPEAMGELVRTFEAVPGCGLCGSVLVDYEHPRRVQAVAGAYAPWCARTRHEGAGDLASMPIPRHRMLGRNEYPVGASLMLSRELLESVGLLSEDYFLYFEELDLVARSKGKFSAAVSLRSVVRHRDAAATGAVAGGGSLLADYCFARARMLYTRKFHPYLLPTVAFAVLASAVWRLVRRRAANAAAVWRGICDGVMGRSGAAAFP